MCIHLWLNVTNICMGQMEQRQYCYGIISWKIGDIKLPIPMV